jgi:outer membrane lipoprotein-sorting protein
MKKYCIFMAVTVLFFATLSFPAPSSAETAREIVQKYSDQFTIPDETTKATMTLINKLGKKRIRSLTIITKEPPGGQRKTLIRFTAPESIYGTGLLIWENEDRSDDQWLYLPALKKTKKISSTERSHSFMGSEFAYEDLHGEEMRDFDYKLLRSEPIGGHECYVIEATPISKRKIKETGYSKRILWIRKDIFFKIKAEYYDKAGRLLKTETDEELVKIGTNNYRMNEITMLSDQTGKKTILSSSYRAINKGIPDSKFTIRSLERGT